MQFQWWLREGQSPSTICHLQKYCDCAPFGPQWMARLYVKWFYVVLPGFFRNECLVHAIVIVLFFWSFEWRVTADLFTAVHLSCMISNTSLLCWLEIIVVNTFVKCSENKLYYCCCYVTALLLLCYSLLSTAAADLEDTRLVVVFHIQNMWDRWVLLTHLLLLLLQSVIISPAPY